MCAFRPSVLINYSYTAHSPHIRLPQTCYIFPEQNLNLNVPKRKRILNCDEKIFEDLPYVCH
jgi:hypothetical protein